MGENAEEPVTESPLFEVEISRDGRIFAPRSLGELEAWLQEEQAFWSWIVDAKGEDATLDYVISFTHTPLLRMSHALNDAKAASSDQVHRRIEELRSQLTNHLTRRKTPTSETPCAQFVSELAKTDKVVAAHALWALLGNDPQGSHRPARI